MLKTKIVQLPAHSIYWTSKIKDTLTMRKQWGSLVNNLTLNVELKGLKINWLVMKAHKKSLAVCPEQHRGFAAACTDRSPVTPPKPLHRQKIKDWYIHKVYISR